MQLGEKQGERKGVAQVVDNSLKTEEEDVDNPMEYSDEVDNPLEIKEEFSTRTIVYEEEGEEREENNLTEFSLTDIPIEVIEEEQDGFDEEQEEQEDVVLAQQFGLMQDQDKLREDEEDISDHVISIEEDGQITIEQGHGPRHSPPLFPEWWTRLSTTFLSFLSTGHLT